ncbi:LysR family transcriptional regulator, partial [Burkholderia multivorans]|uniref:LysR family transcriptional regulator n=1 Tax=Burkholderia multivorans TaxID=87883 RepID=UPI000DB1B203
RGFVAVGRRMSITLAAQDLCVTQAAVSRQIHALEAHLAVALLRRGYRTIAITPDGERQPVTITASIGVTALWLLPRLGGLQARFPDVDLR